MAEAPKQRTVLITGTSSGIGLATAARLARDPQSRYMGEGGAHGTPIGDPNGKPIENPNRTPIGEPSRTPMGDLNETPMGTQKETPMGNP